MAADDYRAQHCWFPVHWLQLLRRERSVLAVAAALSSFVNVDGRAWPRRSAIAARAGVDRRTVTIAIGRLKDLGLIAVEKHPGRASVYSMVEHTQPSSRLGRRADTLRSDRVDTLLSGTPDIERNRERSQGTLQPAAAPKAKSGRAKTPDVNLDAYRVLDAVYPIVCEQHPDLGMSRDKWRKSNKGAALDFVAQGKSPDQIIETLRIAYGPQSKFYGGIVMLDKLAQHWAALLRSKTGAGADGRSMPTDRGAEFYAQVNSKVLHEVVPTSLERVAV